MTMTIMLKIALEEDLVDDNKRPVCLYPGKPCPLTAGKYGRRTTAFVGVVVVS